MALAITLFVFAGATGWRSKIVLGCCVLIQAGAVFLTFSRGAYIGSVTIIVYFLITQKGKPWTRLALLGVLAGAILVMPGSILQRTTNQSANQDIDELSSGRVDEIWLPLIPSVLESPLIGRGHGSILWSEAAKRKEILPVGQPHSAYLAALLDTGIVGTAIILAFLAHAWHTFWKLRVMAKSKMLASFFQGASACIPLLLIQGITDDAFMPRYTQAFLWIAYGAALGLLSRSAVKRSVNHHAPSGRTTTIGRDEK
jgi:O-antigen ligase